MLLPSFIYLFKANCFHSHPTDLFLCFIGEGARWNLHSAIENFHEYSFGFRIGSWNTNGLQAKKNKLFCDKIDCGFSEWFWYGMTWNWNSLLNCSSVFKQQAYFLLAIFVLYLFILFASQQNWGIKYNMKVLWFALSK